MIYGFSDAAAVVTSPASGGSHLYVAEGSGELLAIAR